VFQVNVGEREISTVLSAGEDNIGAAGGVPTVLKDHVLE
jgi:hypothetical protein